VPAKQHDTLEVIWKLDIIEDCRMSRRQFNRNLRAQTPLFGFVRRAEHQTALRPQCIPDGRLHLIAHAANLPLHCWRSALDQIYDCRLRVSAQSFVVELAEHLKRKKRTQAGVDTDCLHNSRRITGEKHKLFTWGKGRYARL
jgi:hypothetical protein